MLRCSYARLRRAYIVGVERVQRPSRLFLPPVGDPRLSLQRCIATVQLAASVGQRPVM